MSSRHYAISAGIVVLALCATPAHGQEAPDTVAASPSPCASISKTLSVGARGAPVESLQKILMTYDPEYAGGITGYFGPVTRAAVIRFQKKHGISPAVGTVGPLTREVIASLCTEKSAVNVSAAASSTTPARTFWTPLKNMLKRFTNQPSNEIQTPVITSFVGPETLTAEQIGQWDVTAVDPTAGTLSYEVNWGDIAASDADIALPIASSSVAANASSTVTIEHRYAEPGTYTITVTVRDESNLSGQANATIVVTDEAAPTASSTIPVEPIGSIPNICPMLALACPAGQHDVMGDHCSHTCVDN